MRVFTVFSVLLLAMSAWSSELITLPDGSQWMGRWVDVTATAYSPHDPIDSNHWSSKDNVTATGRSWVRNPYGIAVPYRNGRALLAQYGTQIYLPIETGYLAKSMPTDRVFEADDTGGVISRRSQSSGTPWIDLRFKSTASARAWVGPTGRRSIRIAILYERVAVTPTPVAPGEAWSDIVNDPFWPPVAMEQPMATTTTPVVSAPVADPVFVADAAPISWSWTRAMLALAFFGILGGLGYISMCMAEVARARRIAALQRLGHHTDV